MMNVMKVFFVIFACLAFFVGFGISSSTTIKINNQVYKCVNFYKQPAFRNSSLNLKVVPNLAKLQQQEAENGFGLSRGCPIGTVPILDRSKFKAFNTTASEGEPRPPSPPRIVAKDHCVAKVQTIYGENKKFFGANGGITIYKAIVESSQSSSSRIKLVNGDNSIEAGWMVNPNVFKDNEAHLYASFSAGGKECINLDCAGFVQVSTNTPLGISPHAYSTVNNQIIWNLSIDKHQDDGNWWLSITSEKHQIGYWPKTLFSTLADVANQVEFGGEIRDPGARNPPPSMGNGMLATYDTKFSSCFFHATVVDESRNNVNPPDTEKVADCAQLYTVLDGGYQNKPELGRLIFYGGPGPLGNQVRV